MRWMGLLTASVALVIAEPAVAQQLGTSGLGYLDLSPAQLAIAKRAIAACQTELSRVKSESDAAGQYAGATDGFVSGVFMFDASASAADLQSKVALAERMEQTYSNGSWGKDTNRLVAVEHARACLYRGILQYGHGVGKPTPPPAATKPVQSAPPPADLPYPDLRVNLGAVPPTSWALFDQRLAGPAAKAPPLAKGKAVDDPAHAGQDATGCLQVIWPKDGRGAARIANSCGYAVEAAWCVVGVDCKPGYTNRWTIGAGRQYPIYGTGDGLTRRVEYAGCRGANTIRASRTALTYSCGPSA